VKRLPFVSYVGRYSIVLLCVHFMIIYLVAGNFHFRAALQSMGITEFHSHLVLALAILVLSALMIPVCRKLLPWFVAQKDLIKLPAASK
ncbi:MAG: hypothetical protein LUG84_08100, partial [Akkermansiaceae bacterium]|nr:hypothetical protein [Akkermansiaceae bacterium]